MKRKVWFILAVIVMAAMLVSAGTLAYFSGSEQATNKVTLGNVKVALIEKMETPNGLIDYPAETVAGVMPGESLSKIAYGKNTGANEIWVRMKAVVSCQINSVGGYIDGDASKIVPAYNTEKWIAGADGWYYYALKLAPDAETDPLFSTVEFSKELDNAYADAKVDVVVTVQAVQTANNGDTVLLAQGWPAE